MRKFDAKEIIKLLDMLIGPTEAVGERNADEKAMENLKETRMSDLISREDAKKIIDNIDTFCAGWRDYAMGQIDNLPTIDPVKRGKWKKTYLDHEAIGERPCIFYCSVCNQCIAYPVNYCPSCGAYMRGDDDESDKP